MDAKSSAKVGGRMVVETFIMGERQCDRVLGPCAIQFGYGKSAGKRCKRMATRPLGTGWFCNVCYSRAARFGDPHFAVKR